MFRTPFRFPSRWFAMGFSKKPTGKLRTSSPLLVKVLTLRAMHGCSRLGIDYSDRTASGSPLSPSPLKSKDKLSSRSSGLFRGVLFKSSMEELIFVIISTVFRRRGILLFAPFLYISWMLLYMGTLGLDRDFGLRIGILHQKTTVPPMGSVYRSPAVFERLWSHMEAENNGSNNLLLNAWGLKPRQYWKPCGFLNAPRNVVQELPESNGFLVIEANGGLNQQRLSICDAVAVAGLLNATLVTPIFHLNSIWRDSSKFGEIFNEELFINKLGGYVRVVPELPHDLLEQFGNNISSIENLRVKAWSNSAYYFHRVLPKLKQMGAVRIAPFSNRLANAVPSSIQKLRCLANYESLKFSEPIATLAEKMVDKMVKKSSKTGGKYVSVHLRFEMDMVAFSCCEYDGGEEEKHEMDRARERGWKGKFRRRGRVIMPGINRIEGKCPLTPLEVGMMLRGMGFDSSTPLYVAAGNIYKDEKYMAPLKQMFPLLETKNTLATTEELALFKGHSSRLAALDYEVCLRSEVFVTTQGGNFPHFLMGHRRYLYGGHAKTIRPDKRKLALLFDNPNIRWEVFKQQMRDIHRVSDLKGSETRKPGASLYTFPMPDCMSKQQKLKRLEE